jgi:hypothetical protein
MHAPGRLEEGTLLATATATRCCTGWPQRATKPWAVAVARLLLASGADASATNMQGKTPAQCAPAGAARDGELYALLLTA